MPPIDVLTNRYDRTRIGANLRETELNVGNVNAATFGRMFSRTVDGDLYAQPLIVSGLEINGKTRNVVFLATSRNWVYAYDADDPDECLPLWQRNLGCPVPRDDIFRALGKQDHYLNFAAEIGITSTPVIDRQAGGGILYLVAKTRQGSAPGTPATHTLHAIDILTGEDAEGITPAVINGTASKSNQTPISFDPLFQLNRPALLLLNGAIYLAFGSQGDLGTFYGWIMAYDAATLAQRAVYCAAPDWGEAGIWQSGCGLAGDDEGFVYAVVGNGEAPSSNAKKVPPISAPAQISAPVFGNCILKLKLTETPAGDEALEVVDWFAATDSLDLNEIDQDLVSGPVVFEAPASDGSMKKMVLGGGKDGRFYLLDRDRMGHWAPRTGGTASHWDPAAQKWIPWQGGIRPQNAVQDDQICNFHIHGAPVIWKKSDTDISAYVWSEKDALREVRFRTGKFDPIAASTSQYVLPQDELRMPGGILTLSTDGGAPGTSIVWASHPTDDDAMNKTVKGTLRAYDARDLNVELWNSDQDAGGDDRVGMFAKFCPPVVANGKVYLATFSRELVVYGLTGQARPDAGIFTLRGFGPAVNGRCAFSCGRYDISAAGQGLSGGADSFFFAYRTIDSNEQPRICITARLTGLADPHNPQNRAGRAGIMIRKFDEAQNVPRLRYAALVVTAANDALFLRRVTDGGNATQDGPVISPPPCWLRLSCERGSSAGLLSFRGEISPDGIKWQTLSAATEIPMDGELLVGLVATPQTGAAPAAAAEQACAVFSDVEVSPFV